MIEEARTIEGRADQLENVTTGSVTIASYTEEETKKRATTAWIICWILAGLSVFLPIAHFFLVPGFLIAGPLAFNFLKKNRASIKFGQVACPHCGKNNEIPETPENWPIDTVCQDCRKAFTILPAT